MYIRLLSYICEYFIIYLYKTIAKMLTRTILKKTEYNYKSNGLEMLKWFAKFTHT